jgi:hypothetical protein
VCVCVCVCVCVRTSAHQLECYMRTFIFIPTLFLPASDPVAHQKEIEEELPDSDWDDRLGIIILKCLNQVAHTIQSCKLEQPKLRKKTRQKLQFPISNETQIQPVILKSSEKYSSVQENTQEKHTPSHSTWNRQSFVDHY